ncbi:GNAT family N-acetyltransferase [Paenibacillus spongiae]|uniref:GNAT family N-acetyltransferase n=1 Tax=Paenibacillus spongiae TaxID=2909671 RepID=A0ABY5S159_9BACL|nr:GNAT family N-acetyltransferase [Paenibacillus spongiae]UVI27592.1 GNAT family N-acetyltransferase [Paenibacillus spongiae]
MIGSAIVNTQVNLIQEDGCSVIRVVPAKQGNIVILYTGQSGYNIFARIVYATGVATKRYQNDLAMFIQKKPQEHALRLLYIRILGDKINNGYGNIMMNQLLDTARQNHFDYIDGHMQEAEHKEHDERLYHFYTKFGFKIDSERNLMWKRQAEHSAEDK